MMQISTMENRRTYFQGLLPHNLSFPLTPPTSPPFLTWAGRGNFLWGAGYCYIKLLSLLLPPPHVCDHSRNVVGQDKKF